jgi:hypothetical protein
LYQYRWPDCCFKKNVSLPAFENNIDVPNAGVLLALPCLLEAGLLLHNHLFDQFEEGYYSLPSIQLSLVLCFLLRLESIEKISKESPGELGKIIGLDRIPEARTLRSKIKEISSIGQCPSWLEHLSRQWMHMDEELAGVLYIDGHEKVYFGKQSLPKRYITRLRLAMRGSTDYWVCNHMGQPFFSINTTVHGSMIQTIKEEIIPRLESDVPNQPTPEMLDNDNFLHRFMIVYDRECYSHDFIIENWEKRIACCTYNKNVRDSWPLGEFKEYEIETQDGEKETILLAERAVLLKSKEIEKLEEPFPVVHFEETQEGRFVRIGKKRTRPKKQLWVREVRKLRKNGQQTSILTSNYKLNIVLIGLYMFARWCQENFFKYMIKNFGFDMLISFFNEKMDDTKLLINPQWRELDKKVRSKQTKLQHLQSKFGEYTYKHELSEKNQNDEKWEKHNKEKAEIIEQISIEKNQLDTLKEQRAGIERKIPFAQLADEEKFDVIYNERKQYVDTLKLIAYRAETGLVNSIIPYMSKPKTARSLIVQFFRSAADFEVNSQKKCLIVKIHNQPRHTDNKILENLCQILNDTETIFPQTDLKIVYGLVSKC